MKTCFTFLYILLLRCPYLTCNSISTSEIKTNNAETMSSNQQVNLVFNGSCEPNTFVQFDCNTCFCNRTGNIDPKWCTYDDCEVKGSIINANNLKHNMLRSNKDKCTPGSVTTIDCNFCICPVSGSFKDIACTKNICANTTAFPTTNESLFCLPLEYYEIDCNICLCPKEGKKNLATCTKKQCETRRNLRSDNCIPGELFTNDCNICICPSNGVETEKVCTDHLCDQTPPWREIFKLSEQLLGHKLPNTHRQLQVCFPGEEFIDGCKICTCPNQGLKEYAKCIPTLCELGEEHLDIKEMCIKYDSKDCVNASYVFFND